ncbi:uncharacterized protein N7511_005335 [Penicillium nucicola]|uniref:uncharacterized protein n=1 Tax=Penicillium nucicola TaxID=1850975 RepID=UPI0025457BAE|nr:uncharacterized protein N7511_005335 [Penicillium nucicola]KAJ5761953.1 hypothetical protein N7511_005335 [Penicillium nucicola]
MSLCPHLVRTRLTGLLSPQCRSAGRLYRYPGAPNLGHRVQHISTSRSFAILEPGAKHDDLRSSDISQFPNHDPKIPYPEESNQFTTDENANAVENSTSKSRQARRNVAQLPLMSKTEIRKIIHAQGLAPSLVNPISRRINIAIQKQGRPLKKRSLYLTTVMRLNSIYTRELGLRQWKPAYEAIYKAKVYQREVINKAVLPTLRGDGEALLEMVRSDCHGKFREKWEAMTRPQKAFAWQRLAIWLLQNDPALALEFLLVTTATQEKPDFTLVADCLMYLERFHYEDSLENWRSGHHTFQSVIETCLNPKEWPIVQPPHKGFRLFIRRASANSVNEAFRIVKERGIFMTAETALCFMNRFTEFKDTQRALESLEFLPKIKDPEFGMNSEGVTRHCCKLLTLDTVEDKDGGRNFRILPQLLKMGVNPERDMMNVVLANAYKTGDPQLGSDMLQFMKNHNLDFDSYTYLTLLTDAVSRGDRGRVDELVQEVEMQEELQKNPYIFSKIFHAHYTFTAKHIDPNTDPSEVFYSMLEMYNRLHDITPLKELHMIPPQYTQPPTQAIRGPPSPVALFLMISTFFRCKNRQNHAHRMYEQFRTLAQQGHPSIAPLIETDHVYNEFLIAFRRADRGLRGCVRLVEDMLDPSSMPKETADANPRTWTILLSAFNYHHRPDAAEKVRQMMTKHNVQYNDVTWNTIINGYANAQNIPETAAAIKMMEQQGFAIDPYTMKSLRYLRDPERLWVSMEELDDQHAQRGSTPTPVHPMPEPTSEVYVDTKERDLLIDRGLEKMKPKL